VRYAWRDELAWTRLLNIYIYFCWFKIVRVSRHSKWVFSTFLFEFVLFQILSFAFMSKTKYKQLVHTTCVYNFKGSSLSCSYGSWICNYPCNQCLSPLMWDRISISARCTTLCDKVCQWLAAGRWFYPGPPVSSIHDITEILLKVALNTIKQTNMYNLKN